MAIKLKIYDSVFFIDEMDGIYPEPASYDGIPNEHFENEIKFRMKPEQKDFDALVHFENQYTTFDILIGVSDFAYRFMGAYRIDGEHIEFTVKNSDIKGWMKQTWISIPETKTNFEKLLQSLTIDEYIDLLISDGMCNLACPAKKECIKDGGWSCAENFRKWANKECE